MNVKYVQAWRKADPQLEAEAARVWSTPGVLPAGEAVNERLNQLALVAYEDGSLAGLTTLEVKMNPYLRQKFAFIRGFVLPDFRMRAVGVDLMVETYDMIEKWAFDHQDENIAGMVAVLQVPGIGDVPYGTRIKFILLGYNQNNQQIRVAWFDHFRVPFNLEENPPFLQQGDA